MFRLRLPENSGSDNKYIHSYLKLTFHYTQLPNEVIKFRCYVFIHMTYIYNADGKHVDEALVRYAFLA